MVTVLLKRYSGCITSRMKTGPSMCGLLKTQPVKLGKLFSSDVSCFVMLVHIKLEIPVIIF